MPTLLNETNNLETIELAIYNNFLYGGTHNESGGCRVYRYDGGKTWSQVNTDGFGDGNNEETTGMIEYNACLYVGTSNETTGVEVWRYDGSTWTQANTDLYAGTYPNTPPTELWSFNGSTWTQVIILGFDDVNNHAVWPIGIYEGSLYLGTGNEIMGTEIWQCSVKKTMSWLPLLLLGE